MLMPLISPSPQGRASCAPYIRQDADIRNINPVAFVISKTDKKMEVFKMKKNIGSVDRIIRLVIGLFVLSLIFWGPKSLWGLLGIIPLGTALFGYCLLYIPLGISTCKRKTEKPA
jgi:hypothetical protein